MLKKQHSFMVKLLAANFLDKPVITVTNQAEWNAFLDNFTEDVFVEINSSPDTKIEVYLIRDDFTLSITGTSFVRLFGGSAFGQIVVQGNAVVESFSSHLVATENSRVVAYGKSGLLAFDNASVIAYDDTTVLANDKASVTAYGFAHVEAGGKANVEAWGSSRVEFSSLGELNLYEYSVGFISEKKARVGHVADYAGASFVGIKPKYVKKDDNAHVRRIADHYKVTPEQYLDRGYSFEDGIRLKIKKTKTLNDVKVVEGIDDLGRTKYVVKKGNTASHGDSIKKAKEDLKFKLAKRDVSRFKKWKKSDTKPINELALAYRIITGACQYGVEGFLSKIEPMKECKVSDAIKMTKGQYGHEQFKHFFQKVTHKL